MTAALLLALALAGGDNAQAIIDTCKRTSSDADRIACLEAAILMRESATQPDASVGAAKTALETDGEAAMESAPAPSPAPVASGNEAEAPTSAVESGKTSGVGENTRPVASGIGAQQVIARQQSQEEMLASLESAVGLKVAKYETVPYRRLQVTLENGQVWRQIKGDTQDIYVSLRKNQTVDINESSLGGYKLRLNELRRTVRVQRVR